MTVRVRILPSGREYVSEGSSSLLEAGLSAGLRVGYGCSNGNCGKCVARIIAGEVKKTRLHDYVFTRQEIASGHVLMCCNTALTDVVLQAGEASDASEIPQQKITAKVKRVSIVNDNVALLHLRTPRSSRLRFLAGQQVQLGGNGIPLASHPVGSCPCDDMHLHFQIPLDAACAFSKHVFNTLRYGDAVEINGPLGDFILDEDSHRSLIFIAWRTGFAPIKSLVEHAMSLEQANAIHLLWAAEDKADRYLDNLCRSWADALDNFYYVPVDTGGLEKALESGREIVQHLDIESASLAGHDCYIAGNESFVSACKSAVIDHGLPRRQVYTDPVTCN